MVFFQKLIDKSRVTCIKWIPGSPDLFLVTFTSGFLYVMNASLQPCTSPPHYQTFKTGHGYTVSTCKAKSTRNPLYRWAIGEGCIYDAAFSPCFKYLAVVSEDGFLRVFDYNTMDLVGSMRSYFGGLTCVAWSPDSKYIATGGKDDLVSVYSMQEKRTVCRGRGHRSWINAVAFDPFTTKDVEGLDFSGSDEELNNLDDMPTAASVMGAGDAPPARRPRMRSSLSQSSCSSQSRRTTVVSYRLGSVGQDTQICLWDLTEDILHQPVGRQRTSVLLTSINPTIAHAAANSLTPNSSAAGVTATLTRASASFHDTSPSSAPHAKHSHSFTHKFATLALGERSHKEHKRNFSLSSKTSDKSSTLRSGHSPKPVDESWRLLGTNQCPRLDDIPMLEPLVCKKISPERLTTIVFREDCIVTACQDGFVCTWARPGQTVSLVGHACSLNHL